MKVIEILLVATVLGIQSYYDIRYKKVPLLITLIGILIGFFVFLWNGDFRLVSLCRFFPGVLCLLYARVTREALGYGDGLLIGMLGFYFSAKELLGICVLAFMIGGFIALVLLVLLHKNGKQEIPFVPFLFVAVLIRGMMHIVA